MSTLAEQQAVLVRALVARGDVPAGFDAGRVDTTVRALLRKRVADVSRVWPALLADEAARARFVEWADGRPKTTSFEDGLAFALDQDAAGALTPAAAAELRRHRPRRSPRNVFRPRRHHGKA